MPEAPEIEALLGVLRPLLEGRTILSARAIHPVGVRPQNAAIFARRMGEQKIVRVSRRGKYLLLELSRGLLLVHFKFDGRLIFFDSEIPKSAHVDVVLHLDRGKLAFLDPRHLGSITWRESGEAVPALRHLGVDVLSPNFTKKILADTLGAQKQPIKTLLLDQHRISGIGNIYSSETLWRARIDPRRSADRITPAEWRAMYNAVVHVIRRAVECCSNPPPKIRDPDWWFNGLDKILRVYQREGQACRRCGSAIQRIRQDGRSSYFCAHCQT